MSKAIPIFMIMACTLQTTIAASAIEAPQAAVMPFRASGVDPSTVKVLDDLLSSLVMQSGHYRTLAKADIDALLHLEKMKDSLGCSDATCAAAIGGALGVPFLITGSVARLGKSKLVITLQLLDVFKVKSVNQISHTAAYDEDRLDIEITVAVAKLLGTKPPDSPAMPVVSAAPSPAAAEASRAGNEVTVVSLEPKVLTLRATAEVDSSSDDPLTRLLWTKRALRRLCHERATLALHAPPYNVAPESVPEKLTVADEQYVIDGNRVVLTWKLEL